MQSRNVAINRARELFNQASHVEEDPLLMVKSQFYIGVCYDLQNEKNAAIRWYERAFTSATELAIQLNSFQPGILTKSVDGMIKPINALTKDHGSDLENFAAGVLTVLTGGPFVWTPVFNGIEAYKKHKNRMEAQRRMEIERVLFFMAALVPVLQTHGSALDLDPF